MNSRSNSRRLGNTRISGDVQAPGETTVDIPARKLRDLDVLAALQTLDERLGPVVKLKPLHFHGKRRQCELGAYRCTRPARVEHFDHLSPPQPLQSTRCVRISTQPLVGSI